MRLDGVVRDPHPSADIARLEALPDRLEHFEHSRS
jgi:hypothetical protein